MRPPTVGDLLLGNAPDPHPVRREAGAAVIEDRGDPAQDLALDHPLEVGQEVVGRDPDLGGGGVIRALGDLHRALEGADHGDVGVVVGLGLELARRRRLDRGRERVGALLHLQVHVDLEEGEGRQLADRLGAGQPLERLERPLQPELRVGRGGDREPEVELVRAQVVVGDARVGVDDLRRAVRVLGVDLGGDEHRLVAERPGVEDRGDLADDALVEQALGAAHRLARLRLGLLGDRPERLGGEREARLQQVHQPLVGLVERDRRAVLARADLRLRRYSHPAASLA